MKKVVFSVTNARNQSDKKLSGFGYITEGNLLCPCISKNNKPYIRVFEDVENRCRPYKTERVNFKATLLCTLQKFPSIAKNPVITMWLISK